VFPEGTRSRAGKMGVFRPGIGLLAKEAGVRVLPVGLRGLYDDGGWFHSGKVEVRVGEMVPAPTEETDLAEWTRELERRVRELVEEGVSLL